MPITRSRKRSRVDALEPTVPDADMASTAPTAKLFNPLSIADGKIKLSHRVVMAPMTRNRGVPLTKGSPEEPNRVWLADELVAEYYEQRASKGGLIITEGIPPSIEVTGYFIFCPVFRSQKVGRCNARRPRSFPRISGSRMEESCGWSSCQGRLYLCSIMACWESCHSTDERASNCLCICYTMGRR